MAKMAAQPRRAFLLIECLTNDLASASAETQVGTPSTFHDFSHMTPAAFDGNATPRAANGNNGIELSSVIIVRSGHIFDRRLPGQQ
jgi:hypothetical protein